MLYIVTICHLFQIGTFGSSNFQLLYENQTIVPAHSDNFVFASLLAFSYYGSGTDGSDKVFWKRKEFIDKLGH